MNHFKYQTLFFKHTWKFLTSVLSDFELKKNHVIAVSGGRDSMALLAMGKTFSDQGKIGPVRAIFIHHHTRPGQDQDQKVVEEFCRKKGVAFEVLHAKGLNISQKNFEERARVIRHQLCLSALTRGELLWMGHHLDDSYEWSLMQRSRSSNAQAILGIPLRNKQIIRPFMSVSREQISRFVRAMKIPFREDPTNVYLHHDRNYLRAVVIPLLKKRFPQYLKHYVRQSNSLARKSGVSLIHEKESTQLIYPEGALLIGKEFSANVLKEIIHTYSHAQRGEVMSAIEAMQKAILNQKKGPFSFSGGVRAYYSHEALIIFHESFKNLDEAWARELSEMSEEKINNLPFWTLSQTQDEWLKVLESDDALSMLPLPILVFDSQNVHKSLKTSVFDPLFPQLSAVCQKKGWRFIMARKFLENWEYKRKKMPKSLRIIPLSSLSHHKASQASNTLL